MKKSSRRARVEFYNTKDEWERSHVDEEPPPDDWRWRVKAGNNEIVASGEGHPTKEGAENAFETAVRLMDRAYMDFDLQRTRAKVDRAER